MSDGEVDVKIATTRDRRRVISMAQLEAKRRSMRETKMRHGATLEDTKRYVHVIDAHMKRSLMC